MKKSVFFLLSTCCLFLAQSAEARLRGYFAVRGGLSDVRETEMIDEHEASFVPAGAIGVYSGPLRLEAEYAYLSDADFKTSKEADEYMTTSFHRVMGNGYLDLAISRNVRPYVSAGMGIAHYDVEFLDEKETGSNFVWSAGGGVGLRLTRNVTADAGVRYVDLGKVEFKESGKEMTFDAVETYAGLRFMF